MRIRTTRPTASLAVALALVLPAHAQSWVETFAPTDGAAFDSFGFALAGDSGRLLVSSLAAEPVPQVQDCGAAYVFERGPSGWVQTDRLDPSNPVHHMQFGRSLALSGYDAVVGAPTATEAGLETGAVYAYRKLGAWTETQLLVGSSCTDSALFGYSVAMDGGRLVVGAPTCDAACGADQGAVFVYEQSGTTWVQTAVLEGLPSATPQAFGHAVDIQGDRIVVGAPLALDAVKDSGRVYVYENAGGQWVLDEVLTDPEAVPHDRLGYSVDLDGDLVAAGQPHADVDGVVDAGAAQVFQDTPGGWVRRWVLGAQDPAPYTRYGYALLLRGTRLFASSPWAPASNGGSGRAWLHGRAGGDWLHLPAPALPRQLPGDGFGSSMALVGDEVAFGRWGDSASTGTPGLGSVSVFDLQGVPVHEAYCFGAGCPCGNIGAEGGCQNSTGTSARLSAGGSLSLGRGDLELAVDGLPQGRMAVLLVGASAAWNLFGDGLLCVSGGASGLQLAGPARSSGVAGALAYDLSDLGPLHAGMTRYLQVLYRDPLGPCSQRSNLSNAVGLRFVP
jgi:hypothetical protein